MLRRRDDIEQMMHIAPVEEPTHLLTEKVQHVLDVAAEKVSSQAQVVQINIPIAKLDPIQWLKDQAYSIKLFWEARDGSFFSAGVGVADMLSESNKLSLSAMKSLMERKLSLTTGTVRYYGGMRFDTNHPGGVSWPAFGDHCFVLPRFEIQGQNGAFALCCNLVLSTDSEKRDELLKEITQLKFPLHALAGEFPLPISRADLPDEGKWHYVIKNALSKIRNGHLLEKVVLARKVEFSFTQSYDKFLLFKRLREATPSCFHFYFQVQSDHAFLGAPPERLYKREGQSIVSEAVAGTGRRDSLDELDAELGHALLLSNKDQHEHAFVRKSIEQVFKTLCTSIKMDKKPSLMNLSIGRHLRSIVKGILQASISDIDILHKLPPTSAVGGHPKQEALETIRQLESFDRGWYAGSVGWMSKDSAEFAVAIRSGLASKQKLALYSGAGIVDGSEPEGEWDEIEQKLGDFIKALGLDQKSTKY